MWDTFRRFNPFVQDVAALDEPPFDPRRQSWAAGAIAAIEAFSGAVLAVPFLASVAFAVHWVLVSPGRRSQYHFHYVTLWTVAQLATITWLSAALLWAGLSLMFGWRTRYRAQGVLGTTLLAVVVCRFVLVWLFVP